MGECVFCRIVTGELPCSRIYEDNAILSFLDIAPAKPGHALVIPKTHYETFLDIPPDELPALVKQIQIISRAVVAATNAEGFNVAQYNGECGGQVVPHLHFHIIPRHPDDAISLNWDPATYGEGEIQAMQKRIVAAIS